MCVNDHALAVVSAWRVGRAERLDAREGRGEEEGGEAKQEAKCLLAGATPGGNVFVASLHVPLLAPPLAQPKTQQPHYHFAPFEKQQQRIVSRPLYAAFRCRAVFQKPKTLLQRGRESLACVPLPRATACCVAFLSLLPFSCRSHGIEDRAKEHCGRPGDFSKKPRERTRPPNPRPSSRPPA